MSDNTSAAAGVGVTQVDRDAAAAMCAWFNPSLSDPGFACRGGKLDDHAVVQAFARHRILALESSRPPVAGSDVERLAELLHEHDPMCGLDDCRYTASKIAPHLAALATPEPPALEAGDPNEQAVPLIFYDSADRTRRLTSLADLIDSSDGHVFSIVGCKQLAADLRALEALRPNAEDVREAAAKVAEGRRIPVKDRDGHSWADGYNAAGQDIAAAIRSLDLNTLSTERGSGEWQPIDSAPYWDGAKIIGHDPKWGVGEMLRNGDKRWILAAFNGQIIYCEPAIWRAMPQVPNNTAQEEGKVGNG